MNSKIEQILLVTFPRKVYSTAVLSISVYRTRWKERWLYCVATSETSTALPQEFNGLLPFVAAFGKPTWHLDWDDLVDDLNDYDWHLGRHSWSHPEYADRVWEQYLFWIGLTVEFWKRGLKPKEYYDDLGAEAKEQARSHLQLVHSRPHIKPRMPKNSG